MADSNRIYLGALVESNLQFEALKPSSRHPMHPIVLYIVLDDPKLRKREIKLGGKPTTEGQKRWIHPVKQKK